MIDATQWISEIKSRLDWIKSLENVTIDEDESLRAPRGAMIFYRKGEREGRTVKSANGTVVPAMYDLESRVNFSVFPSLQGVHTTTPSQPLPPH